MKNNLIKGIPASPGIAIGKAFLDILYIFLFVLAHL